MEPREYPPQLTPELELKAYKLHADLKGRLSVDFAKEIVAMDEELQQRRAQDDSHAALSNKDTSLRLRRRG